MNMSLKHDFVFNDLVESIKEVTNTFGVIQVLSYLKTLGKHSEYIRGTLHLKGDEKINFIKSLMQKLCPLDFVVVDVLEEDVIRARVFSKDEKENSNSEVFCTVETEINSEFVKNLMINAVESGIYYWCVKVRSNFEHNKESEDPYYAQVSNDGWSIKVYDEENECHYLNRDSLKKGIHIMKNKYGRHYNDAINENDDAITADVYFQCCTYGEVIYG